MIHFRLLFLLCFLFFADKNSIAQTLKMYKDAENHFEIGIPLQWNVTQADPRLKLIAIRTETDEYNAVPENINLNFIPAPNGNLDSAYAMSMESNSSLDGFLSFTKHGVAADGHYKWYINTHQAPQSELIMQSIVFVFFHNQKAVLLTCTASKENFDKFGLLFFRIANSLKLQ